MSTRSLVCNHKANQCNFTPAADIRRDAPSLPAERWLISQAEMAFSRKPFQFSAFDCTKLLVCLSGCVARFGRVIFWCYSGPSDPLDLMFEGGFSDWWWRREGCWPHIVLLSLSYERSRSHLDANLKIFCSLWSLIHIPLRSLRRKSIERGKIYTVSLAINKCWSLFQKQGLAGSMIESLSLSYNSKRSCPFFVVPRQSLSLWKARTLDARCRFNHYFGTGSSSTHLHYHCGFNHFEKRDFLSPQNQITISEINLSILLIKKHFSQAEIFFSCSLALLPFPCLWRTAAGSTIRKSGRQSLCSWSQWSGRCLRSFTLWNFWNFPGDS